MKFTQLQAELSATGISASQWQSAMDSAERIEKLTTDQGIFWLKKAAPARGIFRYHALNFFAWAMRLPLLKAVPQPGGEAAIDVELKRIQSLHQAGVLVPRVVAHRADWMLIEHVGESIVKTMKQADTTQAKRQQLFALCLQALKQLHSKDLCLSQGFVRNLLIDPVSRRIAFVDFEDNPLAVMSLPEAQARDLLLLATSTARFFVDDVAFFEQQIKTFLTGHDPQMVAALKITTDRLQWLTRIPFQGFFGHDYQKLKVGILALKGL